MKRIKDAILISFTAVLFALSISLSVYTLFDLSYTSNDIKVLRQFIYDELIRCENKLANYESREAKVIEKGKKNSKDLKECYKRLEEHEK